MSELHPIDFAAQLELAWAAGFFDGEGWTGLNPCSRGYSYVRVMIAQVALGNLERFKAAVGDLGSITGPVLLGGNCSPFWRYAVTGVKARSILERLWPYLGTVKCDQALASLDHEVRGGGEKTVLGVSPRPDGDEFRIQSEVAWSAGLFDGEGCTYLSTEDRRRKGDLRHVRYVLCSVKQNVRENLDRFQRSIGGKIHGPHKRPGNAKPYWVLGIASGKIKEALDKLWPYLGATKREQAEKALSVGKLGRGSVAQRGACIHGHPFVEGNIYLRPDGRPKCKTCVDAAERLKSQTDPGYKARKRQEAKRRAMKKLEREG